MKIIIGREEQTSEPRLRLIVDGQEKFLATKTPVPKTMSRKHCELTLNGEEIVVRNITDNNTLFVNGQEVVQKKIKKDDKIQLGSGMYTIPISAILSALGGGEQEAVSIAHLEKVYNDFQQAKLDMQIRERKMNALSRFSGLITTAGLICALIPSLASIRVFSLVLAFVAGLVLSLVAFRDSTKTPNKIKEMADKFHDDYVCPKCGKSFGNMYYSDLAKYVACPSCKIKFKH